MPGKVFWAAFAVGAVVAAGFSGCGRDGVRGDNASLVRATDEAVATPFGVSVRELADFDVVGPNGDEFGEVDYVLVDASGQPTAVVVELEDRLFGADRRVQMAIDSLSLRQGENSRALVSPLTIEEVRALDAYTGSR